jgi:hypothetical protein
VKIIRKKNNNATDEEIENLIEDYNAEQAVNDDIEQEVITNIFDEYEKEYGDKYLNIISKE